MSTFEQEFSAPGTASGISWDTYKGHLLLFTVDRLETGVKTSLGDKDAIRADVAVLDGPDAGEIITDTLVFPRVLIGQLKAKVGGGKVLGRLGQGEAKPGQNPPWKLSDFTEADAELAKAHLSKTAASAPPF